MLCSLSSFACTSALVAIERGKDGRWLLWKHRDSGFEDNYVMNFAATDSTLAYVALYNAPDTAACEAWIGFNEAGFAVMNTASYNLVTPDRAWQDREGFIMTESLRHCRTVEDFYALLTAPSDKPRGVEANFGVMDADGNGAYFEVDNACITRFPLDAQICSAVDSVPGILTRTNYSLSGHSENRLGLSRHCSEQHLLDSIIAIDRPWAPAGRLAAEDFIETMSRSFYLPSQGIDLLDGAALTWRDSGDVISRRSSSASVVIEGPIPGESPKESMTMWVAIGFPALSVVAPARIDSVAPGLLPSAPNNHSPLCDEVKKLRAKAFIKVGGKASGSNPSAKTRPAYDFNLDYLRRQVPQRRAESLRNWRRR